MLDLFSASVKKKRRTFSPIFGQNRVIHIFSKLFWAQPLERLTKSCSFKLAQLVAKAPKQRSGMTKRTTSRQKKGGKNRFYVHYGGNWSSPMLCVWLDMVATLKGTKKPTFETNTPGSFPFHQECVKKKNHHYKTRIPSRPMHGEKVVPWFVRFSIWEFGPVIKAAGSTFGGLSHPHLLNSLGALRPAPQNVVDSLSLVKAYSCYSY